jgi:acetyl esterase/lipase
MRLEEVSDLGAELIELGIEVQLHRSVSRISYFVAGVALPRDAAPARVDELSGLPSTFIGVSTADCLRDESIDFAARLCRAAVPTELHVNAGAVHGFDMFADTAVARTAARDSADWLARQFG